MANHPFLPDPGPGRRPQRGVALPWVFFGFLAVAGFFFFTEHRAHLMGALPFLLLALCPLMHLFHGGHGGHPRHGAPGLDLRDAGEGSTSPDITPEPPTTPRPPHPH